MSKKYEKYFFFDVETTGLNPGSEEIIEFAYVIYGENFTKLREKDWLIKTNKSIPEEIQKITNITPELIAKEGVDKSTLYEDLKAHIDDKTILIAYNAPFDLQFYYHFMCQFENDFIIKNDFFDVLAVYRDRFSYPHRLENAIEAYKVEGDNSHRAIDDIIATANVFRAMAKEKNNLIHYINKIGYLQKFGLNEELFKIFSYKVIAFPQNFNGDDHLKKFLDY